MNKGLPTELWEGGGSSAYGPGPPPPPEWKVTQREFMETTLYLYTVIYPFCLHVWRFSVAFGRTRVRHGCHPLQLGWAQSQSLPLVYPLYYILLLDLQPEKHL